MVTKFQSLDAIVRTGALLIVRLDSAEEALAVSEAAIEGGVRALEITLSVPGALDVISKLSERYGKDGVVIGAGTVLDEQAAHACVSAGANLLVSPNLNPAMIAAANRYQAVTVSGAFTPTEIVDTMQAGADIVKLFPAEFMGPDYVRTVKAPLPQAPLMPAGGVSPDNVKAWFDAGVVAVGVGSSVTKAARPDGDYRRVTEAARTVLRSIEEARA
ncbi:MULTISPECIES: bifunctional 4-hydroxy-2-oxoglutarate aldolase/2-dehydro-3-deoxy-phosphogluconate aldolase [Streptomyces]|uniref:Bifunctional 4-hydroxy-2-oxoglutarate aldolase/2-dehydro-3-deoxy-phosphogluconate aldolase n=1 Tax=Streptomyces koelreuteriae TaxID=2838015 RepID=A0ABX8FND7_9ACTN|nr:MULTISPECIES: bifunctional 4-hydroxy-2-oxoglutarate aldolase/2-dehydro-3-deoxy-phosphogluconate aldolase [Streptomyces]QWB22670.1 bifunctional 4-hydroxy-2-oxoglutarate aldolase/2-dehydro-3-deoxy-phosphogluconate aldolase [Streptomyces koelreuteriae]UUA05619.1 bifunctional 4-hydroxy-2-oxoglutarate aldolase/2-dehydro-3-deoxy-phosphogluconate aldolase [Streptomyces koelreuteriae]UUA13246.1 bifunctional 4-hydroxy-2-oxoglutarate aldolase/2-dehydro-3-deoxy-phosphogluconate aldolase [Streptomyces sp